MFRLVWLAASMLALAGCHAPRPSFDVFSPFGPTRAPAPRTGSYGAPDARLGAVAPPYYRSDQSGQESVAGGDWGAAWRRADKESAVAAASGKSAMALPAGATEGDVVKIVETTPQASDANITLKGMPVNDATRPRTAARPARSAPGALQNISSGSSVTMLSQNVPSAFPLAASRGAVTWASPTPMQPGNAVAQASCVVASSAGVSRRSGTGESASPGQVVVTAPSTGFAEPGRFNPAEHVRQIQPLSPASGSQGAAGRLRGLTPPAATSNSSHAFSSTGSSAENVSVASSSGTQPQQAETVRISSSSLGDGWKAR